MRSVTALVSALALAACSTVATTIGFPAADADDNDALSQSEFHEFLTDDTKAYGNFDDNDDGMLNRTEYNEAVDDAYETDSFFRGLDRDSSGMLSQQEFIDGWFNIFDTDRNGTLTRREFEAAIDALEPEL